MFLKVKYDKLQIEMNEFYKTRAKELKLNTFAEKTLCIGEFYVNFNPAYTGIPHKHVP